MKRLVFIILILLLASTAYAKIGSYGATSLTGGGTGALDAINGSQLSDGDTAMVVVNGGTVYHYILDSDSGATETSPQIIAPDSNAGDKRWVLVSTTADGQVNLLKNTGFQAFSQAAANYNHGDQITLTDVTNGVCSTADTEDIQIGSLFTFDSGDLSGNTYVVTAVTADTTFTINDTSQSDSGAPGTGYEVVTGNEAVDDEGPDGWTKQTASKVYRVPIPAAYHKEFYGLKIVGGSGVQDIYYPGIDRFTKKEWYTKFSEEQVTMGAWCKSNFASQIRLGINDGVTTTYSSYNVGTGWEWLTVTKTMSASITRAIFSATVVDTKTAYFSCPIVVYGSSCPRYVPPQDKWIPLEAVINSASYYTTGYSDEAATQLIPQIDTLGKIGVGVEAISLCLTINDFGSAVSTNIYAAVHGDGLNVASGVIASCSGVTNDARVRVVGVTQVFADELDITIDASGSGTMDVLVTYQAIRVK